MESESFGVVVARFQTPELHAGHRHLLDWVAARHRRMLVVLGTPRTYVPTAKNPLDLATRRALVQRHYPAARVIEARDCRDDALWSRRLDTMIAQHTGDHGAVLYGSRDSFIRHYSGALRCVEIPPIDDVSATELRLEAVTRPSASSDFRCGVVYAATTRPGVLYPTVDVAIVDRAAQRVLFARKHEDGGALRFVGGFVSGEDRSLEDAARREAIEETGGIEIAELRYLGSARIDDWRYRGSADGIVTALFVAEYVFGRAIGSDDVDETVWVARDAVVRGEVLSQLVPEHRLLGELLIRHLDARR